MEHKDKPTTTPALTVNGKVEQWNVTPPGKSRRAGVVIRDGDAYLPFVGFGPDRYALRRKAMLDDAVCAILAAVS